MEELSHCHEAQQIRTSFGRQYIEPTKSFRQAWASICLAKSCRESWSAKFPNLLGKTCLGLASAVTEQFFCLIPSQTCRVK